MVCYSIIFDLSDFYMSQDVMMLIDDIKVFILNFSFEKLTKIESVDE